MERAKNKNIYYITAEDGFFKVGELFDYETCGFGKRLYEDGNYFATKKEAEDMIERFQAVLAGYAEIVDKEE